MPSHDVCRSIHWMKKRRSESNLRHGLPENWASDALDCYLDGMKKTEIAVIMKVDHSTVDKAICKEALFRLMQMKAVERLEDMGMGKSA